MWLFSFLLLRLPLDAIDRLPFFSLIYVAAIAAVVASDISCRTGAAVRRGVYRSSELGTRWAS
jgi:hypothetical protein